MDLDARQTRSLLLAGTIPFPAPFPTSGAISLTIGGLKHARDASSKNTELVVSGHGRDNTVERRLMRQIDVAGIFIPGVWDERGVFHIANAPCVDNFDQGEWFLDADVNAQTIRQRLKLRDDDDIATGESIL